VIELESRTYGYHTQRRRVKFQDPSGNVFVWFSSAADVPDQGDEVELTGMVKGHSIYGETAQTVLTRCRVAAREPVAAYRPPATGPWGWAASRRPAHVSPTTYQTRDRIFDHSRPRTTASSVASSRALWSIRSSSASRSQSRRAFSSSGPRTRNHRFCSP
jgi:hypothetical protein